MKPHRWCAGLLCVGVWVVTAESQSGGDIRDLMDSLPLVGDLPANYQPVGTLGGRGEFYAADTSQHRVDDGDAHHGLPATVAWAENPKDDQARTQGLHYEVDDGRIISAGYVIRRADLVAGNSFYGLTLRELDFPAAHSVTIELFENEAEESQRYLWRWHFLPQPDQVRPMLSRGELQTVTRLPGNFTIVPNEQYPTDFYPRMGRHRRDVAASRNRLGTAVGNESVWYGEAAGKLIFIEYIFSQQDFSDGTSWFHLPLNGVPIPPIDNVHILHYNGAQPGAPGLFTAHMYFFHEEEYLSWATEPPVLEAVTP
jgi:hypothetical protein